MRIVRLILRDHKAPLFFLRSRCLQQRYTRSAQRSARSKMHEKAHINDKWKTLLFFSLQSICVYISKFVYGVINEKKRDPRRTHRDSHVKSRVCKRLIIYRFNDPFNRRSLKFIEGYLREIRKNLMKCIDMQKSRM